MATLEPKKAIFEPKMAIFEPKPFVNPLGKMWIFRLYELLFCFSVERRFFVLEYRETHFPFLSCQKKNVAKMTIFGPKPWVSPLGKMAIFRVFELFSFYNVERRFFVLEYRKRHFPGLNCLKRKSWKNGYFSTKTMA